jgi:hypothetical protein
MWTVVLTCWLCMWSENVSDFMWSSISALGKGSNCRQVNWRHVWNFTVNMCLLSCSICIVRRQASFFWAEYKDICS